MAIETKTTQTKWLKLAISTSNTSRYLSDQLVAKFGTARKSEIYGTIEDTGAPWEQRFNDYLDSL